MGEGLTLRKVNTPTSAVREATARSCHFRPYRTYATGCRHCLPVKQLPHVPNSPKPHPERQKRRVFGQRGQVSETTLRLPGLRPALLAGVPFVVHVRLGPKNPRRTAEGGKRRRASAPPGPALGRWSAAGRGVCCQAKRGT